jgi:next to BRCA1 gene 1 protein
VQVEEPQTSGNKLPAALDLNLPPAANRTALKPFIDTNSLPKDPFFQYPLNIYNEIFPHYQDSVIHLESELEPDSLTAPNFQFPNDGETSACFQKPIMLKESEPASSTLPSASDAVKQVQIPTTDHTTSSGLALTSMAAAMPAPETIPLPKSVSFAVPVSAPIVDAPASFPGHAATNVPTSALPDGTINQKEEKLLRELVELGFGHVELNKEMLRRNNYDLEESVREICSLDGWDPLFGELNELVTKITFHSIVHP